jgi:hypothetical protein
MHPTATTVMQKRQPLCSLLMCLLLQYVNFYLGFVRLLVCCYFFLHFFSLVFHALLVEKSKYLHTIQNVQTKIFYNIIIFAPNEVENFETVKN